MLAALRQPGKKMHPLEAVTQESNARPGLNGMHQNDPPVPQRDPPITH